MSSKCRCRKCRIFKHEKFILFHTDCLHVTNYLFLNIILIVKRHIFYDTCVMYLMYDEIELKKMEEVFLRIEMKKTNTCKKT